MAYKKRIDALVESIETANSIEAREIITMALEELPAEIFIREILLPVLEESGSRYMRQKEPSLAQAYVSGKVAKEGMDMALEKLAKSQTAPLQKKGRVIMANIEDDFHSLGREIVVSILRANSWDVIDIGNDAIAANIVDEAVKRNAPLIGVSAMMYSTALNIKKVREELDSRGLSGKIKLAVGGAVFVLRNNLVDIVGGDGTCKTALDAPELMEKLLKELKNEQ